MIRKPSIVAGSVGAGVTLLLGIMLIPTQFTQQAQQTFLGTGNAVNQPVIIRPAYATGTIDNLFVIPSNNIVGAESFYHIGFSVEATGQRTGEIQVAFPSGFNVTNVEVIQESGLLSGNGVAPKYCFLLNVSGTLITCHVNGDFQISGTVQFMLDLSGIQNGYITNNQVSMTMIDDQGVTTFGPTLSPIFTLSPLTNAMIGNGAVNSTQIQDGSITSNKIAPGAISLITKEFSSNIVKLAPGKTAKATATCGSGMNVTGGGYDASSASIIVIHSGQSVGQGWDVVSKNKGLTTGSFMAFAMCAKAGP